MRIITAKNARRLRPGTKLMMIGFKWPNAFELAGANSYLLTYVVKKHVARKIWRSMYSSGDVWYYNNLGDGNNSCYTMFDSRNRLVWKKIYVLSDDEFEKLKVLNAL
jgi:hypothetical protein